MKSERIEKLLEKMIKEEVFPGAVYALITKEKTYMGAVGSKTLVPEPEKNSVDTLYDLASLTKVVVTNTIITKMLYKNMINLDDKVCDYLSEFKYDNITIMDLLTHSSGLDSHLSRENVTTKSELINRLYSLELKSPPGEKVVYSDIGFMLLGLIIEKLYGKPLDVVAKEEVFIPLNMNDSYYNPKDKLRCAATEVTEERGVVRGVVHDEKSAIMGGVAGHAGVFSTIGDITKFCKMVQNKGKVNNEIFLPEKYIDLWFKPLRKVKEDHFRTIGWIVGNYENVTGNLGNLNTIFHTGFTGNSIVINREMGVCAILLTNRVHPTRENKKLITRRKDFLEESYKVVEEKMKKLVK